MTSVLKSRLQELAQKYEVASFVNADPSQFLRWYTESDTPRTGATSPSQSPLTTVPGDASPAKPVLNLGPSATSPSQPQLAPGASSTKPGAASPSQSPLSLRSVATSPSQSPLTLGASSTKPGAAIPSQPQLALGASSTKPGAVSPFQPPLTLRSGATSPSQPQLALGASSTKPGAASPSQSPLSLRSGATIADVECASFIAAMLAFGNRKQFIPKIGEILTTADTTFGTITAWLTAGAPHFPHGSEKFYRFYSFDDMHSLFTELAQILHQAPTIGNYFQKIYKGEVSPSLQPAVPSSATLSSGVPEPTADCTPSKNPCTQPAATPQRPTSPEASLSKPAHPLDQLVSQAFPKSTIVPKGKNSANKRIHMFLRWMVRTNSPVDLGIWNWYPKSELLIPLDVHVMQEGINLGLLPPNAKASRKTAAELSQKLAQAFPGDPTRGDFALFGLGVDKEK